MLLKCCYFGTKVTPVSDEVMTISLNSDSKNNNFVEKVISEVPDPPQTHCFCFRICFWRKNKIEIEPIVATQDKITNREDRENALKPVLARQSKYPSPQANGHTIAAPSTPPQPARFVSPIPSPLQLREPSPIAPLVPSSPSLQRHEPETILPLVPISQNLQVEDLSGDNASDEPKSRPPSQGEVQVDTLVVEEERLRTPPPASSPEPPADPEPDTTKSEEMRPEERTPLSRRKFDKHSGKSRLRSSRGISKEEKASSSSDIAPLDNPKEALSRSIQQLEHPEWEVTIQGLQTLVRLTCHHTTLLSPVMHQVVVAVTKHVRNLRSQVARAACRAATQLFATVGRGIENDMEELCAVLLSRTADTNKFLRGDCNTALDAMVDNLSPSRIVALVVSKGVKHQNAVVRATSCRLLLRLCQRLGPDRVLSLPRETRDAILNTGARSLTEGSLDTRRFAKEMFILLSQDPRLTNLLSEVVPTSVMRSISKVLARIIAK